jgi:hypothetical protein
MRTKSQIDFIKGRISDPYSIESFLTKKEIVDLIDIFKRTQDRKVYKNTGPVTLNLVLDDPVISTILDKLKSKIGNFAVTAAFFFYTETPHIIHNDDTFELPDGVYKAVTLPLELTRDTGEELPELCFFDQFYFHGPAKFFNGSTDIPTFYNRQVYEYSEVDGLSDREFCDSNSLLTHLKPAWLKGLSLHSSIEWRPGNAIVFDSVRLHCASDFTRLNITGKLGISIFTKVT